ncbi:MAG: VCBS repeat-containing protein, partial [Cyclobacteriaceae bacterium]
MKKLVLLYFLTNCLVGIAQPFEENLVSEVFPYVDMSSINWVDYNKDGYLDLFIAGVVSPLPSSGHPESKLFKNINGEFQEVDTPFEDFSNGDSDWIDYDNDGDLDLMITGLDHNADKLTKLYNNNSGLFTEVFGNSFAQVGFWGGSAWADYDLDGDLDVFVTGAKSPGGTISELYRNDAGTFTNVDIGVFGVNKVGATRAAEWFDFDNDNDPDLMLVSQSEAILYENVNSDFQIVTGTPFAPQIQPTLNIVDYDGDGDFDVMIAGNFSTKLYTNTNSVFVLNSELSDL